jgi:hypothetical protein
VLWGIFSCVCAQTKGCSLRPELFTVANERDVAKLTTAALCDNAIITANWRGNIQLTETIVVGNGTSLTVTGASAKTAGIDGGKKVQLFEVAA